MGTLAAVSHRKLALPFRHPLPDWNARVALGWGSRPGCPRSFREGRVGRLKQMPSRLGTLPSRVKALPKMAERFYQSAEWIDYRQRHAAWTRERLGGLWCAVCGGRRRLILDHRRERKDGGADFPPFEECDWLCGGCHNAKTAKARGARAAGAA